MDEIFRNQCLNHNHNILQCIRNEWMVLTMAFQHQQLLQADVLRSQQQLQVPIIKVSLTQAILDTMEAQGVEILANNVKKADQPVIQISLIITNEGQLNLKIKKNTSLLVKKDLTHDEFLHMLEYPYVEYDTQYADKIKYSTGLVVKWLIQTKYSVYDEDHS